MRSAAIPAGGQPHILIVTNVADRYRGVGVQVTKDCIEGAGALGGLYTARHVRAAA